MDERDYEPEYDPRMAASGPARRSGAVTAVAVVNFVVGGLLLILGLVIMIAGPAFIGMALSSVDPKDLTPEQAQQAKQLAAQGGGFLTVVAGAMGVCFMILGVPAIIAGFGVLNRRQWGRILTIVLGAFAIVFAVLNLLALNILGVVLDAGYAVLVFVILLNKQYAAEFR